MNLIIHCWALLALTRGLQLHAPSVHVLLLPVTLVSVAIAADDLGSSATYTSRNGAQNILKVLGYIIVLAHDRLWYII